jgi:gliding motility associated protien GldN
MKKFLIFNTLFILMFSNVSLAQEEYEESTEEPEFMIPKSDIFDKTIVEDKTPIGYYEIGEEDVPWSRFVWRVIDCRERMNYHMYYPIEDTDARKSLMQALANAIVNKKIQAYGDENFKTKLAPDKVMEKLGASTKTVTERIMGTDRDTVLTQTGFANWRQVREFKIKEKWFFDKKHSRMDVRILAICPMKVFKKDEAGQSVEAGGNDDNLVREEICWIYFPEARKVLANTACYTGKNLQANTSFDDIFHKRFFSSRIVQATNVNDLTIENYTHGGLEALFESEKIKQELLNFESDLWSY